MTRGEAMGCGFMIMFGGIPLLIAVACLVFGVGQTFLAAAAVFYLIFLVANWSDSDE